MTENCLPEEDAVVAINTGVNLPLLKERNVSLPKLIEKSIIIHKDENGFGLRLKGQSPVFIEHVHENGAAWRAGVRAFDLVAKVNGMQVHQMSHKEVVLAFKSCSRFVALTLISPEQPPMSNQREFADYLADANSSTPLVGGGSGWCSRQPSTYSQKVYQFFNRPESATCLDQRRMSTATNYSIISSSSLISTKGGCQSTTGLAGTQKSTNQRVHQLLAPASALGFFNASQTKLNRQGPPEQQIDKRVSICICCRNPISSSQISEATSSTCAQCQLISYQEGAGNDSAHLRHSNQPANERHLQVQLQLHLQIQHQQQQPANRDGSITVQAHSNLKMANKIPLSSSNNELAHTSSHSPQVNDCQPSLQSCPQPLVQVKKPVINKRIEIIREFIDTERAHTERLRCLNELFYRPLKQAGFISIEQLRLMFSCHRTLYRIHKQIYRILMSANYDAYSEPLVGSALLEIFEGDLKKRLERAACTFCSAQATNIELLNKLTRRDTKAGEFLAHVTSQQMVGRLGVKDLLASCFQRLTKYPLLLESLLKETPEEMQEDSVADFSGGLVSSEQNRTDSAWQVSNKTRPQSSFLVHSPSSGHNRKPQQRLCGSIDNKQQTIDWHRVHNDNDGAAGVSFYSNGNEDEDDEEDDERELDSELGHQCNNCEGCDHCDDSDCSEARMARLNAAEEARRNSRRIMAISLAEEREFIGRALLQSRQILVRVNESIKVAIARNRLKEIWKRTDKYPDVVPLIDITKQQVVHEGLLTLRLSKRSFDVYVLLLNDYIIILTREGQDKYRLKFFTPEGKSATIVTSAAAAVTAASATMSAASYSSSSSSFLSNSGGTQMGVGANNSTNSASFSTNATAASANVASPASLPTANANANSMTNLITPHQMVYSPVFVIDEHLTTRDAATDENGFYLLCKRKDDSRIYEFASRSPAERMKWRDRIQAAIERQMSRKNRRSSCTSTVTKSSSEISANDAYNGNNGRRGTDPDTNTNSQQQAVAASSNQPSDDDKKNLQKQQLQQPNESSQLTAAFKANKTSGSRPPTPSSEPTKIVGTISYVIDDGIVPASKMESSRVFVDQAIQVNILDGSTMRGQLVAGEIMN